MGHFIKIDIKKYMKSYFSKVSTLFDPLKDTPFQK